MSFKRGMKIRLKVVNNIKVVRKLLFVLFCSSTFMTFTSLKQRHSSFPLCNKILKMMAVSKKKDTNKYTKQNQRSCILKYQ